MPATSMYNIKKMGTNNDNYLYTGVSGVDDDEKFIQGHPPGGVAILYKKSLSSSSFITHVDSMAGSHMLSTCIIWSP